MAPQLIASCACWYQAGARNGYGAHVAIVKVNDQEVHRVKRASYRDAIEEARMWATCNHYIFVDGEDASSTSAHTPAAAVIDDDVFWTAMAYSLADNDNDNGANTNEVQS